MHSIVTTRVYVERIIQILSIRSISFCSKKSIARFVYNFQQKTFQDFNKHTRTKTKTNISPNNIEVPYIQDPGLHGEKLFKSKTK